MLLPGHPPGDHPRGVPRRLRRTAIAVGAWPQRCEALLDDTELQYPSRSSRAWRRARDAAAQRRRAPPRRPVEAPIRSGHGCGRTTPWRSDGVEHGAWRRPSSSPTPCSANARLARLRWQAVEALQGIQPLTPESPAGLRRQAAPPRAQAEARCGHRPPAPRDPRHAACRRWRQPGVAVGSCGYCDHAVARNLEGKSAALPLRRPMAHLVSTPCLCTLSKAKKQANVTASPFASDALWSPRSPRGAVARMIGERYRRGRRAQVGLFDGIDRFDRFERIDSLDYFDSLDSLDHPARTASALWHQCEPCRFQPVSAVKIAHHPGIAVLRRAACVQQILRGFVVV
jgi:hypothetical protein